MECLAKNIYFEARGEPMVGQFAVAQVVINRVKSPNYPNTICGVVYQTNQFSWVKERFHRITNGKDWANALNVAYSVLTNDKPYSKIIPKTVMYYHTITSHPVWDHSMIRVATIGNHVFYKMKE